MIITGTSPQDGQTGIGLLSPIRITFDKPVDPESLTDSSVVVVSTKKDTIMVDAIGLPVASDHLLSGSLFTDTFDKAMVGEISIDENDPNTIIFTPKLNFNKATEYKVIISNTIASTDGELLGSIYAFTFTTTSEEQVLSTPVEESVTVLDKKYILADDQTAASSTETLQLVDSIPSDGAVAVETKEYTLVFNKNIAADSVSGNIIVKSSGLLKDGESLVDTIVTVNNNVVTITANIADEDYVNLMLEITIMPGLQDEDGGQYGQITRIYFLSPMSPYYGSISLMRFLAGSLINNIKDITLATGLFYYSKLAQRVFQNMQSPYMQELLDRYAVIYTLHTLITNNFGSITGATKITKTLGDFTINVENGIAVQINNRILAELKKEIDALNLYAALAKSGSFVKSINSVDYPTDIGRLWKVPNNMNEPIGDVKRRAPGSLRSRW